MTNDIIVLIPGIGGSRLERGGKAIYDLSLGALPSLIWNWVGGDLAYTGGSGKPDDGVLATDLFNNQLIPGFFGVNDYDGLSKTLSSVVRSPEQQFFKFPYDWRASNCWAAEQLNAFIRPKLHDWRNGAGGKNAKLWLVCHSMGGLVARYFLEHLDGAAISSHLITLGTPHRGAPKALNALVNGMGLGPLDFSKVIRSFASTYELLPQYPVVHIGDGSDAPLARVADFFGLGAVLPVPNASGAQTPSPDCLIPLQNIDPVRLSDALAFHAAIRKPVVQRMENGEDTPYKITCFFNRRQTTQQSAYLSSAGLKMSDDSPTSMASDPDIAYHRGDGTVPGPSAVPIEWLDTANAIAVDRKHVAMPSAAVVTDIIHNYASPLDAKAYMSSASIDGTIGLTVPPLVLVGEPFEIVVDVIKAAQLTICLEPLESGGAVHSQSVHVAEWSTARVAFRLSMQGTYLVRAKSKDPVRPEVSDWVVAVTGN